MIPRTAHKTIPIRAISIASISLLTHACGPTPVPVDQQSKPSISAVTTTPPTSETQRLLNLINQTRAQKRALKLTFDHRLIQAAQSHSDSMLRHRDFSHEGHTGESFQARLLRHGLPRSYAAENIAQAPTAEIVFQLWLGSPPHYKNMLNKQYTRVGIARSGDYWTADFSSATTSTDTLLPPSTSNFTHF